MKRFVAVLMLAGGLLAAGGANAAVTITFAQSGSDVVATAAGSLTLPSATSSTTLTGSIWPSDGKLYFAGSSVAAESLFCVLNATNVAFGSGPIPISSSSSTGQVFGFNAFSSLVYVPSGFTNGGSINSTVTFSNITLASLGINAGNTVYTCGTDTITIVGPSAPPPSPAPIPTLSEWAKISMMLLMILTVGWYGRRLKQR